MFRKATKRAAQHLFWNEKLKREKVKEFSSGKAKNRFSRKEEMKIRGELFRVLSIFPLFWFSQYVSVWLSGHGFNFQEEVWMFAFFSVEISSWKAIVFKWQDTIAEINIQSSAVLFVNGQWSNGKNREKYLKSNCNVTYLTKTWMINFLIAKNAWGKSRYN